MMSLRKIFKDYLESGAFNSLVPVHAAVGKDTFLTKGGDVLSVLEVAGVDYEGKDIAVLDDCARSIEKAVRGLGSRCRVYQYIVKASGTRIAETTKPEDPVVATAILERTAFLNAKQLSTIRLYVVICYECGESLKPSFAARRPWSALMERLSTKSHTAALNTKLVEAEQYLRNKVHSFVAQLSDTAKPRLLDSQEAYCFLRQLVNFEPHLVENCRLKYNQFVDYQMCASALECFPDHLRLGKRYVRILTLKEPPGHTLASMMKTLHALPSELIVTSEWQTVPAEQARSRIRSMQRHFHNRKASVLNFINSTPTPDLLIDDSAAALVKNLGACLEEIEVRGRQLGKFSLTLVFHDENPDRLKQTVAEGVKLFAAQDAQLIEERYNLLNAYLATIPGNALYNRRRLWLLDSNYVDLSLLFTVHTGEQTNDHLGSEYLAALETNHGTLYYFNLHVEDVAHSLILGATGSGKSFLLNFLITSLQKYSPRTFIFDLGRGYEGLASLFGGSLLTFDGESRPFTINPFSLPPTPEHLRFLYSLVRVLIETGGFTTSAADQKELFEQIENLYAIEESQRRLSTLANILPRTLRAQLGKWVQNGPYAWIFDNAKDDITFSRFQVFDFEGMDKSPDLLEPLLFYILHRANASILNEPTTLKVFVMDEAWRFLRHPTIKAYIAEALKTWRKKNGAMLLATQSTDDLLKTGMLEVVNESCPTKIFLANPGMDREAYQRVFHLTDTEVELVVGLTPKQQFLLKRPDRTKVLNLHVEPQGYWLYTNDPFDNQKKREALDRYGFKQGLEMLARSKQ